MSQQPVSVLRLAIFSKRAKKLFTEVEIEALAAYLSQFPEKGDVIPGTKGLRKLRWSVGSRGKRGGSRVIYYTMSRKASSCYCPPMPKTSRKIWTRRRRRH